MSIITHGECCDYNPSFEANIAWQVCYTELTDSNGVDHFLFRVMPKYNIENNHLTLDELWELAAEFLKIFNEIEKQYSDIAQVFKPADRLSNPTFNDSQTTCVDFDNKQAAILFALHIGPECWKMNP